MGRRKHSIDDTDDSDVSYSPEDNTVFDTDEEVNEVSGVEIDITDPKDLGDNLDNGVNNVNVDDQIYLFDGNVHPHEYYQNGVVTFNETKVEGGDYSAGTKILLDAVQEH